MVYPAHAEDVAKNLESLAGPVVVNRLNGMALELSARSNEMLQWKTDVMKKVGDEGSGLPQASGVQVEFVEKTHTELGELHGRIETAKVAAFLGGSESESTYKKLFSLSRRVLDSVEVDMRLLVRKTERS